MKALVIPLMVAATLLLGACFGSPKPFDRPWVDFGCPEPGICRVRGTLVLDEAGAWPQRRLVLDDGRCLAVDLPFKLAGDVEAWDGRRVAVRGRAVARVLEGPCSETGLLLYAERLTLRPDL